MGGQIWRGEVVLVVLEEVVVEVMEALMLQGGLVGMKALLVGSLPALTICQREEQELLS